MLILSKILITFLTVVLLAKVAERLGPKYAGLLSGFPLGTGIALYFFGWQQGTEFAANAAVYTLSGLSAAVVLAWGYWQIIQRKPSLAWMPLAVIVSLCSFLMASSLLQGLPANRAISLLAVVGAIFLFRQLFKAISDSPESLKSDKSNSKLPADHWLNNRWGALLLRASLATLTILMITGLAEALGPEKAGLLAAFPVSFFPLMLLLHLTKGAPVLASTIKHYPDGIGALATFSLAVSFLFPALGLHCGMLASLLLACLYLALYSLSGRWLNRRNSSN